MKTMHEMAIQIGIDLMESGLTPHEGMVVLARTAAIAFLAENLSRAEALKRFEQVLDTVYHNDLN